MSKIRDANLYPQGEKKIAWVKKHMPILRGLEQEFVREKPFNDVNIAVSIHLEAKTAYLCRVLEAGGAKMSVTGSNPLSTQDDVAAALAKGGMDVYAFHHATDKEYTRHLNMALSIRPDVILDDGGDFTEIIHTTRKDIAENLRGGCEETTTGVLRLRVRERQGTLIYPMISVNDAYAKHLFDNRYGTGQSVWDGIMRTTNLIIAGKTVVVSGYGWCGKGIAARAKGLGASVIVTEIDPIKALEAVMDGFYVMSMGQAAAEGDIFVTATGCRDIITKRHFERMKDGAILSNAGHFDVEVNIRELEAMAAEKHELRKNIMGYRLPDGRELNVLAEGRLVNLASGDGHPAEIMDMSFALQALCLKYILENADTLENRVYDVPESIDRLVAERKLAAMGVAIDSLSKRQSAYLYGEEE